MREVERVAIAGGSATQRELMVRAGRAVARVVLAAVATPPGREAVVLVGPGNNGGDGLVTAELLAGAGMTVTLWRYHRDEVGSAPVSATLLQRLPAVTTRPALATALDRASVVVDAVFGAGQRGGLPPEVAAVIRGVNERKRQPGLARVAVDVPTGVAADDGSVSSDAFEADVTITLGCPKLGLYHPPGFRYAGHIHLDDLGLLETVDPPGGPRLIGRTAALARLPLRDPGAHKGSAGSLLILGGSGRYPSAPGLAAEAALRAGAGLITLAVPRPAVAPLAARVPEATFLPLREEADGDIGPGAVATISGQLDKFRAIQVGNGLGQSPGAQAVLSALLLDSALGAASAPGVPVLIDADGLNWLATIPTWWRRFATSRLVLTPHPGEMARLLGADIERVTREPWAVARDAATTWGQVVVLKGGHTVIASPDGGLWVAEQANPALATAGSGDTLAGVVAGLLAQGLAPEDAAVLGLYLGSRAAELATAATGVLPLVASDLPRCIGAAILELEQAFGFNAVPKHGIDKENG